MGSAQAERQAFGSIVPPAAHISVCFAAQSRTLPSAKEPLRRVTKALITGKGYERPLQKRAALGLGRSTPTKRCDTLRIVVSWPGQGHPAARGLGSWRGWVISKPLVAGPVRWSCEVRSQANPERVSKQHFQAALCGQLARPTMHTSPASSSGNPATSPLLRSPSRSGVPASGNSPAGRLSPASAARRWLWFGRRPSRSSSPVGLLLLLLLAVIAGAILIWLLATRDKSEVAAYVAMCLIVKDQPRDVVEWVHHHQRIGVGKFYVFDHNSSVPLVKELHPLIEAGAVRYQYFRFAVIYAACQHPDWWPCGLWSCKLQHEVEAAAAPAGLLSLACSGAPVVCNTPRPWPSSLLHSYAGARAAQTGCVCKKPLQPLLMCSRSAFRTDQHWLLIMQELHTQVGLSAVLGI